MAARLLVRARGDDDQAAAGKVGVIACVYMAWLGEGYAVVDVRSLAFGLFAVHVHQHHLGKQAGNRKRIGARRTGKADADHAAFLHIGHIANTSFPSSAGSMPASGWKTRKAVL